LLRLIDRFVELDGLRRELVPFYSEMGRPSIDPELLIRMLIVGYCFGIRSERRLCEEVHLNLAYRWFCGFGLDGEVPDHSTFSKNRHGRFRDSDLLRRLFETVLQRCIEEGLVGGEGFAVDASLIQADASDRTRVEGAAGLPSNAAGRAVEEYLAVLDDAAFRRGNRGDAQVHRTGRSGDAVDRGASRARVLCLFGQLPDRYRPRDHCRCRSNDGDPSGRAAGGEAHGRALEGFDLYPAKLIATPPMERPRC
jgi:transposase